MKVNIVQAKYLLILVLIRVISSDISILVPVNKDISKGTESLIQDVLSKNVTSLNRIMYASDNLKLNLIYLLTNYTKLIYNYKLESFDYMTEFWKKYRQIQTYFLILNSTMIINKLKLLLDWNSRAKFIIYYYNTVPLERTNAEEMTNLKNLFINLSSEYIYNVVVITNSTRVFNYQPYKYENIRHPDTTPVLIQNGDYFANQIPRFWRNSSIRILSCGRPPYFDVMDGYFYDGIDFQLLEGVFQPHFKFIHRYKFVWTGNGEYEQNGTYSSLLGDIANKEGDLGMGGIKVITPFIMIHFEPTFPFHDDDGIWNVPTPPLMSHTWNLARLFSPEMWAIISATFLGACVIWGMFSKLVPNEVAYCTMRSSWHSIMMPWMFLFSEISYDIPRASSLRILYICTWIFIHIVNACWEALLIITLTYTNREKPIQTLQEVMDRNLVISILGNDAEVYNNSAGELGKLIYKKNIPVVTHDDFIFAFLRIAEKKDMASIGSRKLLNYMVERGLFIDGSGIVGIRTIEEQFMHYNLAHVFAKGHPLFEAYNEVANWIRASGVADMYLRQFLHRYRLKRTEFREPTTHNILTMDHLVVAFVLLVVGLAISAIVFIIEKVVDWHKKKTRTIISYT